MKEIDKPTFVIVTPARDEEPDIEHTIESMLVQTVKPAEWIIVNDGSSDGTGRIIDEYAASHDWIRAIHRKDRGYRKAGAGVIAAFYDGFNALRTEDWQFVVKFDGDLSFEPDYFEACFRHFRANPKLGIGGGVMQIMQKGRLRPEKHPIFHVRGGTKIYRRECWNDIGGLIPVPGWDTLDELKANKSGWQTRSFSELKLLHRRHTGDADGLWRTSVKYGMANYISGYHPLFMLLKCVKRLPERPYITGSIGMLYGFIRGYLSKTPQVDDKELIAYVRSQQIRRLLFRDTIWRYR